MTKLEFINKEVSFLKDMIEMDLALVEDEEDLKKIAKKQERLQLLEQIKNDLEAWEVVKKRLEIYSDGIIHLKDDFWCPIFTEYTSVGYKDQYQTLKKALEVE